MKKYDYYANMRDEIYDFIDEEMDLEYYQNRDDLKEYLYSIVGDSDLFTGGVSGSYTFSSWEAEENICHNLDLLAEAVDTFYCGTENIVNILNNPEACDVMIRQYLVYDVISDVVDNLDYIFEDEKEDEDDDLSSFEVAAG